MAKRYFCNISDCLKLMINPETSSRKEEKRLKVLETRKIIEQLKQVEEQKKKKKD